MEGVLFCLTLFPLPLNRGEGRGGGQPNQSSLEVAVRFQIHTDVCAQLR